MSLETKRLEIRYTVRIKKIRLTKWNAVFFEYHVLEEIGNLLYEINISRYVTYNQTQIIRELTKYISKKHRTKMAIYIDIYDKETNECSHYYVEQKFFLSKRKIKYTGRTRNYKKEMTINI